MKSSFAGSQFCLAGTFICVLSTWPSMQVLAADDLALEEVVVTAQKRSENVQDVPIAITAFTAEALRDKGISEVSQLSNSAPNVTFDAGTPFSGSSAALSAYIRGIGQNDFAFNLDPGVGVYVDGVYLARTVGANTDLGDVERIEVLKGPQGTLFGRNTIGGAVSIVTRDPGNVFKFSSDMTTGRYNRVDIKASADLPLADNLLTSLSFSSKKRDGYLQRIPFPAAGPYITDGEEFRLPSHRTTDTEGGQNEFTLRGKAITHLGSAVKLTFAGDYTKMDQPGTANTVLAITNNDIFGFSNIPGSTLGIRNFSDAYNTCIGNSPAALAGMSAAAGPGVTLSMAGVCGVRGVPYSAALNPLGRSGVQMPLAGANVDSDPYNNRLTWGSQYLTGDRDTSYATGSSYSIMKSFGGALTADITLSDTMNLKSITGYRELHWDSGMDADGSPIQNLELGFDMNQHQFSEELQLTGEAFNDRLQYVVGAYYFTEGGNLHDFVPFPAGLLQVDGENLLETKAWAGFVHLNYKVTENLGITLGARYTDERKTWQGFQSDLNGFNYKLGGVPLEFLMGPGGPCTTVPSICQGIATAVGFPDTNSILRYVPAGEYRLDFKKTTPRVGLEYHFGSDVMAYASYSQGFKTGGWTTRYSAPRTAAQVGAGFRPETADSYELGLKTQLWGRRLELNTAVFLTDYNDIQLNQQEGLSPTLRNAGDAQLYGFEIESQARLTSEFSITASVGYNHARYTQVSPEAALVGITKSNDLPKTPEWKVNVAPRYRWSLSNNGGLVLIGSYTYTSSLQNNTENTPILERGAVSMLDASLRYEDPSDRWNIALGATNLTDERYLVTGAFNDAAGIIYGTYNRPTEWYVTLGVKL